MKRYLVLAVLFFAAFGMRAQEGEIVYVDFEPDIVTEQDDDLIPIDFDEDGVTDVSLVLMSVSTGYQFGLIAHGDWQISYVTEENSLLPISEITNWNDQLSWVPTFYVEELCVRKSSENAYYYGWFRAYNGYISYPNGGFRSYIGLDRYAYCTIPDYPLMWGQTELLIVEESSFNSFATLYPNPTNGMVAITGENLQQAEIFNILGQQVLSVQGKGNELRIDMANLPAGVYFVTVTNEEGRKCVRKVVKE